LKVKAFSVPEIALELEPKLLIMFLDGKEIALLETGADSYWV
jgi:hypothetical protein